MFSDILYLLSWEKLYDLDYPESSLKETKFFKTLSLIKESGIKKIINLSV